MTISLQYTHLTVTNPDEAIAFYRDALGLEVQNDVSNGDFRWVTLGMRSQPGLGIVLSEPHAGRSQEHGDAMAELLAKGVLPMLNFSASDLDATFEQAVAAGAEVRFRSRLPSHGARATAPSATHPETWFAFPRPELAENAPVPL
ncbi:VOC family protein [Arthrobacter psychrolactophilus]